MARLTAGLLAGLLLPSLCAADAAPPGPFSSLIMRSDTIVVEWSPVTAAQTYDVVFGHLGSLRSSGGDFTASMVRCLAHDTTATTAAFNAAPTVGQGFWILVRGNNGSGTGTYDSGDPAQVGSRDAEINASPFSCGGTCGDGTCSGIENCGNCPADCTVCPTVCGDGVCNGTESCTSCPEDCAAVHYLEDDFSDNAAGWTLGYEWQIGPALESSCGAYGGDDPGEDHSATGDNGVAGVVLGGCAATAMHDYAYLTSPPFDTSTASGALLSFYRWLNSDYPPFMTNDIEVWNGAQWVGVWMEGSVLDAPIAGGQGWNLNQFDLTPYRNAAMRIRFGMRINDPQVYDFGSWNIDDVLVASCPTSCGDGTCNFGETCSTCPGDCGVCPPVCGDGACNGTETCSTCPGDCGVCPPVCGDGVCNGTETCITCPGDCACPSCGDGTCNGTESCNSCPGDCGACPPVCGDGTCNGTENCSSCPGDCGVCLPPDCGVVHFEDDFSDNEAGWTLGYEWQIGPTLESSCGAYGGDDPGEDHSATGDNGVAGVVLGGCAAAATHDYAYLTSPPFNTSTASGALLSFYRWLNSDYPPFMTNDIEVWNGAQWVGVWMEGSVLDAPIAGGPGWNLNQFDLTPYRNAAMKIRFGMRIDDPQVYDFGSWNIDDLRVSSAACP